MYVQEKIGSGKLMEIVNVYMHIAEMPSVNLMLAKASQLEPLLHQKRELVRIISRDNVASKMLLVVRLSEYLQVRRQKN